MLAGTALSGMGYAPLVPLALTRGECEALLILARPRILAVAPRPL
jgi:hypothetical protein